MRNKEQISVNGRNAKKILKKMLAYLVVLIGPGIWQMCRAWITLTYHFKLALGNSAYAICSKVSVARLNAPQTAQIFIALFLPFGNQIFVCIALFDAIFIKLWEWKQQVNNLHKTDLEIKQTLQNRIPPLYLDWWPFSCRKGRKCNGCVGDEVGRLAIETQLYVCPHVARFQLWI